MSERSLLHALASSFLAGDQTVEQIVARGSHTLDKPWRWLRPLARRYLKAFASADRPRARHQDVVQFLSQDKAFARIRAKYLPALSVKHWLTGPQQMRPVLAARTWDVPAIESAGALAQWLAIESHELQWFADLKSLGFHHCNPKLRHYHYRVLAKLSGSLRLIEAPKSRLKELQRKVLLQLLDKVPAHPAVHGFVPGRSIKTFVAPHVGKRIILRMDLRDFFPSFAAARIQTFFRAMGYPEPVANLLGGICTCATPRDVWERSAFGEDPLHLWETRGDMQVLFSRRHLPQGAPTSPALANLCFYRADCRLAGLARSAGAVYTRYADDLAFSGGEDFERNAVRFSTHVAAILHEEGFTVHHRKTRIMRQGVRQHLAGLVANQHVNVRRSDFDRLKAILTNCARHSPGTQNREGQPDFRAHLIGRVSFVEMINPAKGKRLRTILEQIQWR
jgi:hypothetical protein